MFAKRLYATLVPGSRQQVRFWFVASLLVALLYGLLGLQEIWEQDYSVADDARQYLFWMRRWFDPKLFPDDYIADYFQSVTPWGFTAFYRLFALLQIDPLKLSQLLPLPLGLLATSYGFRVCLQLLPMPFVGFLAALLLNQLFWSHDDLASATPRAFMLPLFLAFLNYVMRRAFWPTLAVILLEGLFYPQYLLVFAGILGLRCWRWRRGKLSINREDGRLYLAGLGCCLLVLLPYFLDGLNLDGLNNSPHGAVITAAEARALPDFAAIGRARFWLDDDWQFWLSGSRSGLFPTFKPQLLGLGLLLPLLLYLPRRFPIVRYITPNLAVLAQTTVIALLLFGAAHALLFRLHLPSRYSAYPLRFVLVFAAALVLMLLIEAGLRWLQQPTAQFPRRVLVWGSLLSLSSLLVLYPLYAESFPKTGYQQGQSPPLYAFLAAQPEETLVASLLQEADNIPTFAQRSVLVAPEYAVPYHQGYAVQFRRRAEDLIQAQYTLDAEVLRQFVQRYGIDFWLVDQDSFVAKRLETQWIRQYPAALTAAQQNLAQGQPILEQRQTQCSVLAQQGWKLLSADCLVK
ncbi:MAG: hypothetical protein KME07_09645 [Pegethrix bostrychoides GSE-TBD4-15B]|jgi:hypothetical protein|uniref:Uncharacterized protein n=1 Tax=Pegethrix bostrychoides GSE-TBD4-15B TaxID=2839662 RepID=A0A951U4G0_9CYAN|nr:hypothetical protein [Pegethrix bostrychoides GSE-TBD4-15B]